MKYKYLSITLIFSFYFLIVGCSTTTNSRPHMLTGAKDGNSKLYYFAVGSNMLKSKLINRGINNTLIDVISIKPAVVNDHRLAFNMKGFPPLEPAMGGIEPCNGNDCHGALIEVTYENYNKIWLSEGDVMIYIDLYHYLSFKYHD